MSVRKFVFDHFLEHAAPPLIEQVMTEFSLSRENMQRTSFAVWKPPAISPWCRGRADPELALAGAPSEGYASREQ